MESQEPPEREPAGARRDERDQVPVAESEPVRTSDLAAGLGRSARVADRVRRGLRRVRGGGPGPEP